MCAVCGQGWSALFVSQLLGHRVRKAPHGAGANLALKTVQNWCEVGGFTLRVSPNVQAFSGIPEDLDSGNDPGKPEVTG